MSSKVLNIVLGFGIHVVALVAFLYSVLHRLIVHSLLSKFYKNEYRLIEAGMPSLLGEQSKGPITVIYVLECEGTPIGSKIVDKFQQIVRFKTSVRAKGEPSKEEYYPFENLGWIVVEKFFTFCWKISHHFQAKDHVFLERDSKGTSLEELVRIKSEQLLGKQLDGQKPQWELHVVVPSDGSRSYGLVWATSHVYADATIMIQLLRYAVADSPFSVKVEPLEWNWSPTSSAQDIWVTVRSFVQATIGSPVFALLYGQCLGQTRIPQNDTKAKRGRNHCRVVKLNLNILKEIQRRVRNKSRSPPPRLVSVLFSCLAPAMEQVISRANPQLDPPINTVLASTIEANYPYRSLRLTINVLTLWFDLPLQLKSPLERLRAIESNVRAATTNLKKQLFSLGTLMAGTVTSPLARILGESDSLCTSTYISNIVGPEKEFTIFGGDRVASFYIYSPVSIEEFTTFVALSYDDKLSLALVAPHRVVQKLPRLLDDLVRGVQEQLNNYHQLCKDG